MSAPISKSAQFNVGKQELPSSGTGYVKWKDFNLKVVKSSGTIVEGTLESQLLQGTQLSCTIDTEAGQWKNRKIFIESILADVIKQCPKDENLVLISAGSDRLLMEYILGKTLIENGFSQISFFLVDPVYAFSSAENLKAIKQVLKDFQENIGSIFFKTNNEHFASNERIRFLSRMQNMKKYFPPGANVLVIESLPPYGENIKDMQKSQVPVKDPKDLITGSRLVPPSHANTVGFIPKQYVEQLKKAGAKLTETLPLSMFKHKGQANFYFDWGCKIKPDGTYSLSFSGHEYYLKSLGVEIKRIALPTGEEVDAEQWIPTIEKKIESMLSEQIDSIKGDSPGKQLSQEDVKVLLEKVKEVMTLFMPSIGCFFSADYALDFDEGMAYLSTNAGHHYRKSFSLMADAYSDYNISVKEI